MRFNQCAGEFSEKLRLESKTDILVDEVEKFLSVNAFITLIEKDVADGKIKYGGNVIYQAFYVDKDGALKKYECGSEYVGVITDDKITAGCSVSMSARTLKADADLSGLKVSFSTVAEITATLYSVQESQALCGGEGLIIDKKETTVIKSLGIKNGAYPVEEEFSLDYPVAEVLSNGVTAIVTNSQCGVGCVIVDGEVLYKALILSDGEIKKEERTVPYRLEVEYEEAMPAMQAQAICSVKNFKTDVEVDGEKSKVNLTVTLNFEAEVFAEETLTVACDAFDIKENLEVITATTSVREPCENRYYCNSVSGRANINELPADVRLVAVTNEKAEVTAVLYGEARVEGVISCVCIFKDGDGKLFTNFVETPFSVALEGLCVQDNGLTVSVKARKVTVKIISLTEVELDGEVCVNAYPRETQSIVYIKEVKPCGQKQVDDCAISVYIPFEGEELWSLAKRLNVCPEELVATNKELQFPLTGKERIVIYRQTC